MALFRKNLRKEIQKLMREFKSPKFKIPENWLWWKRRDFQLHKIEESDLQVIRDVKILQKRGELNHRLTESIFKEAYELLGILERMLHQPDVSIETQKAEAHIADKLIKELAELLELTKRSLESLSETAKNRFTQKFGSNFSIEINQRLDGGFNLNIKSIHYPKNYTQMQFNKGRSFIKYISVDESIGGKRFVTQLIEAGIFVTKELGGSYIGGHIARLSILRIFERLLGKQRIEEGIGKRYGKLEDLLIGNIGSFYMRI